MLVGCRFDFDPRGVIGDANGDARGSNAIDAPLGPTRLIFTTVGTYQGSLGTLATSDALCTSLANGAGHAANFAAVLTTTGVDITTRIPLSGGKTILRNDGVIVATDATFFTAAHSGALDVDLAGTLLTANLFAWTNVEATGAAGASDCVGWTDASNANVGVTGSLSAIDATWADVATAKCNRVAHLVCIEL